MKCGRGRRRRRSLVRNRMEAPLGHVAGAGDTATLAIIAYDGHDAMSHDSAFDLWSLPAYREQLDDG